MRQVADEPFLLVRTLASNHPGGDAIPAHAHDWHQLIYASAGLLTVWTARGSWIVPPLWAVWVPAGPAVARPEESSLTLPLASMRIVCPRSTRIFVFVQSTFGSTWTSASRT